MNHRSWFALTLLLVLVGSASATMSILTGGGDNNARYDAVAYNGIAGHYYAVGAHADSSANWQGYDDLVGEIGFLPGSTSSEVFGVAYGSQRTLVGACNNFGDNWQAFQGVISKPSGYPIVTMTALPMPTGTFGSAAYGISGDGSIIVGASGSSDLMSVQPTRWTSGGTVASLLPLPSGMVEGQANAVSLPSLTIGTTVIPWLTRSVGTVYDASYQTHAVKWVGDGDPAYGGDIALLDQLPGTTTSEALDIAATNYVSVGSCFDGTTYKATRWNYTAAQELPALPGSLGMVATACSFDGSYVVGYAIENGQDEAFIWDAVNGTRSMASFLSVEMNENIDGFTFEHASDVVVDGRTIVIVGDGTYFGNNGWMAVETLPAPEPASLALLALGGLFLRRRK